VLRKFSEQGPSALMRVRRFVSPRELRAAFDRSITGHARSSRWPTMSSNVGRALDRKFSSGHVTSPKQASRRERQRDDPRSIDVLSCARAGEKYTRKRGFSGKILKRDPRLWPDRTRPVHAIPRDFPRVSASATDPSGNCTRARRFADHRSMSLIAHAIIRIE